MPPSQAHSTGKLVNMLIDWITLWLRTWFVFLAGWLVIDWLVGQVVLERWPLRQLYFLVISYKLSWKWLLSWTHGPQTKYRLWFYWSRKKKYYPAKIIAQWLKFIGRMFYTRTHSSNLQYFVHLFGWHGASAKDWKDRNYYPQDI